MSGTGTLYMDTSSKGVRNGHQVYINCWCAEITLHGHRFRHRSKSKPNCERWIEKMKQCFADGTITAELPARASVCNHESDTNEYTVPEGFRDLGEGLMVNREGDVICKNKQRKVYKRFRQDGSKESVKIYANGKTHRLDRLVMRAFGYKYSDDKCVIHLDHDLHNCHFSNLRMVDFDTYYHFVHKRRSKLVYQDRVEKSERLATEAEITKDFFARRKFDRINAYFTKELIPYLQRYCIKNLNAGRKKTEEIVAEVVAMIYTQIDNDTLIQDYFNRSRRMAILYKRTGGFGRYGHVNESIYDRDGDGMLKQLQQKFKRK